MVNDKKYKRHLLITSFIVATVIFLAGIALGWTLDNFRISAITTTLNQNELNTESFLLESQFIENFGGDYCTLLNVRIKDLRNNIVKTSDQLSTWGESKKFKESDFDYLKRKYFLLEIKFLFLLEDMTRTCGKSNDVILFFYKIDDSQSTRQGYALDELRLTRDDMIILSFDKNYADEPLIGILLTKYGINSTPAVVINGQKVLTGYASAAQIGTFL